MDLEQEISKALADPDIMSKVSGILSSINNKEESASGEETSAAPPSLPIGNMISSLGGAVNDDRARLLMAIKPFLSEKRAPYMDSAVTILKFASVGRLGKDLKLF